MRIVVAIIFFAAAQCAFAKSILACYEEPATQKRTCIDQADVRANGNTRSAPVYAGAGQSVKRTSRTFVTNCAKQVGTMRYRSGAEVAGGYAGSPEGARALSEWACSAKARSDPALRPV